MIKIFDYLILVLYVGLLMFLASCEKDLIVDDIIVEEETYSPIEYRRDSRISIDSDRELEKDYQCGCT